MDVKQKLNDFVKEIDIKLQHFWEKEQERNFGFNNKQKALIAKILQHGQEHNLRPAKRLRGSFVYYGNKLSFQKNDQLAWQASMAVEIVHTALLMHDDVMDQDDFRRGKPTTHKFFEQNNVHYGESMAYTVGDALLCLGFELLAECDADPKLVLKATQKILRGIADTAYGQAYDVTLELLRAKWSEDDVIALHQAKTAIYTYENPLFIGAILGGVNDEAIYAILHRYSMHGGVAFQIQDDILGIYGDPDKTGKSANSDLLQGKCTLLILKTFQDGSKQDVSSLEKVWGKRTATEKDITQAKEAIIHSGALDYSRKIAKQYATSAAAIANELEQYDLDQEAINFIQGIAQYMVIREV